MWKTVLQQFRNQRLIIHALALLFGIGAVLATNSIFLQLPLLVNNAPEGWRLPTDMTMVIQLANIGPIIYGIYTRYSSRKQDHWLIYGLMGGGTAGMFALAFLYRETLYIFGAERSIAVLGFLFVLSLTSCTASLLFVPYMKNYRDIYLVSYLVGEGLGGLNPSILALIQGVGGNPHCVKAADPNSETPFVPFHPDPRFSTTVFFIVIGIILSLSLAAFAALSKIPADSPERAPELPESTKQDEADVQCIKNTERSGVKMSKTTYIYLLIIIGIISALGYSVLASIQSYSCLPYGNVAYHLAVTLSWMANPLAMCFGFFVQNLRIDVLNNLIGLIFSVTAYVAYLALMSPTPPLQHTLIGEILVITAWVVLSGLIGFVKLTITTLFRTYPGKELYYAGVATQIGTFGGAVMCFCLINFTGIFVTYSPCKDSTIIGLE